MVNDMKILRLSLFNLKKNKREAAAIVFLTAVTTLMLSIFVLNTKEVNHEKYHKRKTD